MPQTPTDLPSRAAAARLLASALVAVLLAVGCSDGEGDDIGSTSPSAGSSAASADGAPTTAAQDGGTGIPDEGGDGGTDGDGADPDLTARAALLCAEIVNGRSAEIARAGLDASLDLVLRVERDDAQGPTPDEAAASTAALEAHRDALAADRERLAGLDVAEAQQEAWDEVAASVDEVVDLLDARLAVLADPDWASARERIGRAGTPSDGFAAAIEELGLSGRDCEVVATHPGVPEAQAPFVSAAATTCTEVLDRRAAGTYEADGERSFDVLAAVARDEPVEVDGDLVEAIDRVRSEWETTLADVEQVDPSAAADPAAWERFTAAVEGSLATFTERAAALGDGDPDRIRAAWGPGGEPIDAGLEELGLDQRDCRWLWL